MAEPATGIAELYTVTIADDGRLDGVSATGGQLEGHVEAVAGPPAATPAAGFQLEMRMTAPAGETGEIAAAAVPAIVVESGTARLIVREDGQLRGKRTKDTKGAQGFTDTEPNL